MNERNSILASLAKEEYCYLTTTGRLSGKPHEIEIWFGLRNSTLYLLSGGGEGSDWVKNLLKNPSVRVRIAKRTFAGTARLVKEKEEDTEARYLLAEKYQEWEDGKTLSEWARTALPVAIDLISADDL
ncbi:MAG: nitroreductase family deazaflavin-dependent oxidoreductase [Chloroflexi bacterium]|nr:MAG: nitroreductase family deazaflavin-dependent oxidoreductase [Chloroflexota bacterium]